LAQSYRAATTSRAYGRAALENGMGSLHEEGAQVLVAALGDFTELGAIAGRLLP
jgi:aspartate aminotransferase-like enzyme